MRFDWDEGKAKTNLAKHGVSFEEAETIFEPARPPIFDDLAHSGAEWRYFAIGFSVKRRLLVVFFTRERGVVRIISARRPTRKETEMYEKAIRYSS